VIYYFGQLIENYKNSPQCGTTFLTARILQYFGQKNGLGYILGDFFTNSSGHPDLR
jgi:hypothetical protein